MKNVISCFPKYSQTVSKKIMPLKKLKQALSELKAFENEIQVGFTLSHQQNVIKPALAGDNYEMEK